MTHPSDPGKKNLIEDLKKSVGKGDAFEVEKELPEGDLETVSGGECLCKCAFDTGGGSTCGGGGGGGRVMQAEAQV